MVATLLFDTARLGLWLLLLAVVFVPLERLFALHPARIWRKGVWADLGFYFLSSLLPGLVLSLPLAALALGVHRLIPLPMQAGIADLPLAVRLILALVIGEFGAYWGHRWSHEIPLLWRFHAIHHAPEHMDWLVNTRAHPVDMVFTRLCSLVPLYAVGLGGPTASTSLVPALVIVIGTIWGFLIHANLRWRMGPLEHVVASPAFHHWHHVVAGPINRNYASLLPWLDRLFGTHHLPRDAWPGAYGISAPDPSVPARQTAMADRASSARS